MAMHRNKTPPQTSAPFRQLFLLLTVLLGGWSSTLLAADLANGRRLYFDPALGGGTSGKCCFTCHETGRDLGDDLDRRTHFTVMGIALEGIAEVVNFCIEVTLRGEGLDPQGKEMEDLLAYLTWLGKSQGGSAGRLEGNGNKKAPARDRPGLKLTNSANRSAAAGIAAAAGAAAPAASADGAGRRDGKTGAGSGIDKVDFNHPALITEAVVNEEFDTALLKGCVTRFRLIQSQSQ